MRMRSAARWGTAITATALVLTACGGGGGEGGSGTDTGGGGGAAGGAISYAGCKPQNPLIPSNTNETCGGDILNAIFTGLIRYSPDDASSINEIAESITPSADFKTYTIKIKPDWTFQDGTPITAKSFVDTWNYAAWPGNAQLNSYFFENIAGFSYGEDADGDGEVSGQEAASVPKQLSGLKVVDDTTFTVGLSAPYGAWPARLGYSAFVPLPESFFQDPAAFGKNPVGTGPFRITSNDPNTSIKVEKWADYKGSNAAQVDSIDFKVYTSLDSAYADLIANNVDFMQQMPTSALAGDRWKTDLGEGRYVEKPIGVFQSFTFPENDPKYKNRDVRKAISMALDRQAVIQVAFNGAREPATGWVAPVVEGFEAGACGEWCTTNPERAKQLLQQAGGFQGAMTIAYNADGGHKEWVDAACTSITQNLGIQCQGKPYPDFATFRSLITDKKMEGPFRTGWQMDYPFIENFLTPLYSTNGSSNDGGYSNPQFDALLQQASSKSQEESIPLYQEAERLLANDLPAIPLWYSKADAGWSANVSNVKLTPFGTLDYSSITRNS